MLKSFPANLLTTANLVCGSWAVVLILFFEDPVQASYFIAAALVFDVFDGAVARWLKASNALGGELDSLADAVSFGLAPSVCLFYLSVPDGALEASALPVGVYATFAFLIGAVWRLAKFNVDKSQAYYFKGMPTPAASALVFSLPHVLRNQGGLLTQVLGEEWFLGALAMLMAVLMLWPFKLFGLKPLPGKGLFWGVYVLGLLGVLGFMLVGFLSVPIVILLYPIVSILFFRPNEVSSRN